MCQLQRAILLVIFGLGTVAGAAAQVAEEPFDRQLDFVRKLQARGYADLALEYLDNLQKHAPAHLSSELFLQLAHLRIQLARDKEPAQRLTLYEQARRELQKYIEKEKKERKLEEIQEVRLEIARLAGYEGEALLNLALSREDPQQQEEMARKAEARFRLAGEEMDAVLKAYAQQLKDGKLPEEKKQALQAQVLRIRLERGKLHLDQARTYLDTDKLEVREKRGQEVEAARKVLETVAKDPEGSSPEASYLAYAWLIRVAYETQDPSKAQDYYQRLLKVRSPEAQPAQRVARLIFLQNIRRDVTLKMSELEKIKLIQKEAEAWLKDYPTAKNSAEGQAVRFELARALAEEALATGKGDLKTPLSQKLAKRAQQLLADLAATDSEYSRQARQLDTLLSLKRLGEHKPIEQLKDFEECFLRARYEIFKIQELARKKDGGEKARRSQQEEHLSNLAKILERALLLADARTLPSQRDEARYLLSVAYFEQGQVDKALAEAEKVARSRPASRWSAPAATLALQLLAQRLQKDPGDEAVRQRLQSLAQWVVQEKSQVWQNEPILPLARYQLALLAIREHKHAEAFEHLEKLPPDFSAYLFARSQAVFEALNAAKEAKDPAQQQAWKDRARAVVRSLPPLPEQADVATCQMYFAAQIEYGKLLFEEGQQQARQGQLDKANAHYRELVQFISRLQPLIQQRGKVIPEGPRQQLAQALEALKKYGLLGEADLEYRRGNYDKVLAPELAGGILQQVQKLAKDKEPIRLADYQLTGEILGLVLRAQVQKGKVADAQKTLNILQRLADPEGRNFDPAAPLRSLLGELQAQVRELRAKKDEKQLHKVLQAFSSFLDALTKQEGKNLSRNDLLFLASCYSSLGEFGKAAELYGRIQPPAGPPKIQAAQANDPKNREAFEQEKQKYEQDLQAYWFLQVLYAEALRKSKQYDQAKKVLDRILNTPEATGKLLALKEQILLLEDRAASQPDLWGNAILKWRDFLKNPQLKQRAQDNEARKIYFEGYFHMVRCYYYYSQKSPKIKGTPRETAYLNIAADYIRKLEQGSPEGWQIAGPLFQEFLQQEPPLKKAYEQLKKSS
jgi:hypothetical protein